MDGEEEKYEETYRELEITQRTRFDLGVSVRAADADTGAVVDTLEVARSRAKSVQIDA